MPSASAEAAEPRGASPPLPAGWARVRMNASLIAPWYTPILYRLRPVEVAGSEELRIRSGWRLEYGDRLSEAELTALVVEVCDHLEREHLERRGDRDPFAWTQAAAAESVGAWRDLLEGERSSRTGFVRPRFPRQAIHPEMFGLPLNRPAEDYYEYFHDAAPDALALFGPYGPPAGSIRPHGESGGGGLAGPGRRADNPEGDGDGDKQPKGPRPSGEGHGEKSTGPSPIPQQLPEDGTQVQRPQPAGEGADRARSFVNLAGSELPAPAAELGAVRNLVQHEMRQAPPGSIPGRLVREAGGAGRATIPWQVELARLLGRTPGRLDYSLLPRPNYGRLLATGAIASRLQRGYPRTTVVRDTSASMNRRLLDKALAEIESLGRRGVELKVADADTTLHAIGDRGRIDLKRMIGGGGTDMLAAAWEAWRLTRPECLVVLTDGQTRWNEASREPPNTIWVILNEMRVYVPSGFRRVVRVADAKAAA
jgi:hypothetical protein